VSREPIELDAAPPLQREDLTELFRRAERPDPATHMVGTEQEKFGLWLGHADCSPRPANYQDHILPVLIGLQSYGWLPGADRGTNGEMIALERDGATITLEPGGQLELSGKPLLTIHQTCAEFSEHFREIDAVSRPLGLAWLATGFHPFATREEIPRMPKPRYAVMQAYLPTRGAMALDMMLRTCTVQANFDYASEAQCGQRFRLAMGLSALATAIFGNSPYQEGAVSGFATMRSRVWSDVDPDRCGILEFAFHEPFSYERYIDWALAVPMFFVRRRGRYHPFHRTFAEFMRDGFVDPDGVIQRATAADWALHLSTVFPEARLKPFIEVRGADAVGSRYLCALPAMWKGILYDEDAGAAAWELVAELDDGQRLALWDECRRHSVRSPRVHQLCVRLLASARAGLDRLDQRDARGRSEARFLDAIEALIQSGRCPADEAIEAIGAAAGRDSAGRLAFTRAFHFAGAGVSDDPLPDA
jgi:glutamate--cysteine ligase